jgi:trehalose 6-phosphate phosphatase
MSGYSKTGTLFNIISEMKKPLAFFLDLDGTLIDIAPRPGDVTIEKDLEDSLINLCEKNSGRLAIITGRDERFINEIFPNLKPAFAASHGACMRARKQGKTQILTNIRDSEGLARDLRKEMLKYSYVVDGFFVEKKDFSCALHFRAASLPQELAWQTAKNIADDVLKKYPELTLTEGDKVFEMGPKGASKGHVIDRFMALEPFKNSLPVFLEDSLAGISGMEAVKKHGGLSIGIGPATKGHADYLLKAPAQARSLIRRLGS